MDFLPTRFQVSLPMQNTAEEEAYERQKSEFIDAAKSGYVDLVALYLEETPKLLHATDSKGWTGLQYAIKNGHAEVVAFLLKNSTKIKEININDVLEFMRVCVNGTRDMARFLLKNAMNMNIEDLTKDDIREFMRLIQDNRVGTVRLLIQINTKLLKVKNINGQSGLLNAVAYASAEMLELFLYDDIDLEATYGREERTLLMYAVENGNISLVNFLLKKNAKTEARDLSGKTALMTAAISGMANIVEALILHGANIEARDFLGLTALMTASEKGQTEVVAMLIQYGVNVNAISYGIRTVQNGFAVIQHHGANIDPIHSQVLSTALIRATINGYIKIVKLLLENGAEASIIDCCGMSAGVYAVRNGRMAIVELFLEKGMNLDQRDEHNKTPIMNALDNNMKKKFTFIAYRLLLDMSFEQQKSFMNHNEENKEIRLEFCKQAQRHFIQLKENLAPFYKHEAALESSFSILPLDLLYYIKALELYVQFQDFPNWYQSYAKKYISKLPSRPIFYQETKPAIDAAPPAVTFIYESRKNRPRDTIKQDNQPAQNIDIYVSALESALSHMRLN